jgi:hypothetical protein
MGDGSPRIIMRQQQPLVCLTVLVLGWSLFICVKPAEGNSSIGRTKVPDSGNVVLTARAPKAKAIVTIQTVAVEGSCRKVCPTTGFLTERGAEQASVVQTLSVSIDGEKIGVPSFVYSGLFDIQWASLSYKNGIFDLAIQEGTHDYMVHIYFDRRNGIYRMRVYDEMTAQLVEDARFFQASME